MDCAVDFYRGLRWRDVNWVTRHRSRCYAAGINTSMVLLMVAPFVFCFALGFMLG